MRWRIIVVVFLCAPIAGRTAFAHRIDQYAQATLLIEDRTT